MKELSIEQKAQRYDEALKAAVVAHKDEDRHLKATLERIFPELKESEDERIRKELISFFTERAKHTEDSTFNGLSSKEILAWLEKQGEQKPQGKSALEAIKEEKVDNANKVEPRQEELTEFEKFERAVKQVIEEAIECGDTHNLKADAEMLLNLAQKPAWSEEDEKLINSVIELIDNGALDRDEKDYFIGKLNSLKERYTWKPSDEQMTTLRQVISGCSYDIEPLVEMEEQLKKLM